MSSFSDYKKEDLRNLIQQEAAELLKDPNINSVGIGKKVKDGVRTEKMCVQFTVDQKIQLEFLSDANTVKIPGFFKLGDEEIPTDVIEGKFAINHATVESAVESIRTRVFDPLMPGISIGHPSISAGTLGCFVLDNKSANICVLSNWHVLQGQFGMLQDSLIQPGSADISTPDDGGPIGSLLRSHLGTMGDCAIGLVDQSRRSIQPEILGLNVVPQQIGEPTLGDRVIKSGRTTAITHGIVSRIFVTSMINYGENVGVITLEDCLEIESDPTFNQSGEFVSRGGDSGSVWLGRDAQDNANDTIMGLHFAGDVRNGQKIALACNAQKVFEVLDISLPNFDLA